MGKHWKPSYGGKFSRTRFGYKERAIRRETNKAVIKGGILEAKNKDGFTVFFPGALLYTKRTLSKRDGNVYRIEMRIKSFCRYIELPKKNINRDRMKYKILAAFEKVLEEEIEKQDYYMVECKVYAKVFRRKSSKKCYEVLCHKAKNFKYIDKMYELNKVKIKEVILKNVDFRKGVFYND